MSESTWFERCFGLLCDVLDPKAINAGDKIGVYCSDVAGAFDEVSASRLLEKLKKVLV